MGLHKLPSLKLIWQKSKTTDDFGYIYLRASIPGTKRYILKSLGHRIAPAQWNSGDEIVTKDNKDSKRINELCRIERQRVQDRFDDLYKAETFFTEQVVRDAMYPDGGNDDFIAFFQNHVQYIQSKWSPNYHKVVNTAYSDFKAYAGEKVPFSKITTELLEKYEMSLNGKLEGTTIHVRMSKLKEAIGKAIDRELISPKQIAGYKWPIYENPTREYLTLAETEKIANEIYTGEFDDDETLRKVACYFLVECYAGVRISDWRSFKVEQLVSGKSFKCRAKKNGEPIYLPLAQFTRLAQILDYIQANNIVFDITDQAVNRLLKIVAKQAKIKKELTSHVGRHTFGTILGELRWTTSEIAEAMGVSENTAKIYAKNLRDKVKTAAERSGGI